MRPLTRNQEDALLQIRTHRFENNRFPTLLNLAERMGGVHESTASRAISQIAQRGLITPQERRNEGRYDGTGDFLRQFVQGAPSAAVPSRVVVAQNVAYCATRRHGVYALSGGAVRPIRVTRSPTFAPRSPDGVALTANREMLAVGSLASGCAAVLTSKKLIVLRSLVRTVSEMIHPRLEGLWIERVAFGNDGKLYVSIPGKDHRTAVAACALNGEVHQAFVAERPLDFAPGEYAMYFAAATGIGEIPYHGRARFASFDTAGFSDIGVRDGLIPGDLTAGPGGAVYFTTKYAVGKAHSGSAGNNRHSGGAGLLCRMVFEGEDQPRVTFLDAGGRVSGLAYNARNNTTWLAQDDVVSVLRADGTSVSRALAPGTKPRRLIAWGDGVVISQPALKTVAVISNVHELENASYCQAYRLPE
jgi:hypothetical protein